MGIVCTSDEKEAICCNVNGYKTQLYAAVIVVSLLVKSHCRL